jgi:uncharacterized membrane protein
MSRGRSWTAQHLKRYAYAVAQDERKLGERYSRTRFVKRLPTVGSLALALILAMLFGGHSVWAAVLIYIGTFIVCMLLLHVVFRQRLERLLQYREVDDA